MKDLVAEAVARTLGISSKCIAAWDLRAQQFGGRPGMPGRLTTHLSVKVVADIETLRRLQDSYLRGDRRGSWVLQEVAANFFDGPPSQLDVVLLYGKETQHIFKALAQMTVYRRNQKGRKK